MTDAQKKMYDWLVHRVIFVMENGLTETDCIAAVNDADNKIREIREARL